MEQNFVCDYYHDQEYCSKSLGFDEINLVL